MACAGITMEAEQKCAASSTEYDVDKESAKAELKRLQVKMIEEDPFFIKFGKDLEMFSKMTEPSESKAFLLSADPKMFHEKAGAVLDWFAEEQFVNFGQKYVPNSILRLCAYQKCVLTDIVELVGGGMSREKAVGAFYEMIEDDDCKKTYDFNAAHAIIEWRQSIEEPKMQEVLKLRRICGSYPITGTAQQEDQQGADERERLKDKLDDLKLVREFQTESTDPDQKRQVKKAIGRTGIAYGEKQLEQLLNPEERESVKGLEIYFEKFSTELEKFSKIEDLKESEKFLLAADPAMIEFNARSCFFELISNQYVMFGQILDVPKSRLRLCQRQSTTIEEIYKAMKKKGYPVKKSIQMFYRGLKKAEGRRAFDRIVEERLDHSIKAVKDKDHQEYVEYKRMYDGFPTAAFMKDPNAKKE